MDRLTKLKTNAKQIKSKKKKKKKKENGIELGWKVVKWMDEVWDV